MDGRRSGVYGVFTLSPCPLLRTEEFRAPTTVIVSADDAGLAVLTLGVSYGHPV